MINIDCLLRKSIFNDIDFLCVPSIECWLYFGLWETCCSKILSGLWIFRGISREHILWFINIMTEGEIVDFFYISLVLVLSYEKFEHRFRECQQVQAFQHPGELLSGNMTAFWFVKVLERRLEQDSVRKNLSSHLVEGWKQNTLFFFCEYLIQKFKI